MTRPADLITKTGRDAYRARRPRTFALDLCDDIGQLQDEIAELTMRATICTSDRDDLERQLHTDQAALRAFCGVHDYDLDAVRNHAARRRRHSPQF